MTHTSTEQPEALPTPEAVIDQAQVFASAWALYGSGSILEPEDSAELAAEEKEKLAVMVLHLHARILELEASQAQRVPLSDEWIKELMGLVSRYGNLNYQECDADYREHQTKSERYAQDQRDTFSAIESKLRTIGITQEKQG